MISNVYYLTLNYTQMLYESYVLSAFIVVAIGSLCFVDVPREGMPPRFLLRMFYYVLLILWACRRSWSAGCDRSGVALRIIQQFESGTLAWQRRQLQKKAVLVHAGQCKHASCELLKMKMGAGMVDTKKHKVMRNGESLPKACLWLGSFKSPVHIIIYMIIVDRVD